MSQSWHLTIQQLNLDNKAVQYPKFDDITDSSGDLNFFPNSYIWVNHGKMSHLIKV